MSDLLRDLIYAARTMRARPGFTAAAAATIAVGVCATTVVFSLVATLLLNPLPVPEPDGLVVVDEIHRGGTERMMGATSFSFSRYEAYREASRDVFADLAGHRILEGSLRAGDTAEVANMVLATANYFDVLGVRPAHGRFFASDANRSGRGTAVLSYATWTTRFGGDPSAIGRTVYVNSKPYEVIGVAPRGFTGTLVALPIDIWVPASAGDGTPRGGDRLTLFGRLRRDVAPQSAAAALGVIARQVPPDRPGTEIVAASTRPLTPLPAFARGPATGFMAMLLATAGLVLLIASANVAGMLLARASERAREIAVRMAIGAGRGRLVRQLLAESVLLVAAGAAAGVLLTGWVISLLTSFQPPVPMRVAFDFGVDARVLAFACGVALVTGVLAGLAPALQTAKRSVLPGLRDGGHGSGTRRTRLRGAFVVVQLALSLLLVVTAGLFARTMQKALAADVGFNPDGVVVGDIRPAAHGYDDARTRLLQRQLLERVRALPGVEAAALAEWPPLAGNERRSAVRPDDTGADGAGEVTVSAAAIGAGYIEALQVPLVAGRAFTAADGAGAPEVAIVNETLARQLWPGASPLGRRVRMAERSLEVVGVTVDGRYSTYTEPQRAVLYVPLEQRPAGGATLLVRSRMEGPAALAAVRRELAAIDPNMALEQAMPLPSLIGMTLFPQRMAATVIGVFGAAGLLLAAIGLYGVLAFHVAARRREIGIRMALGAPRSGVMRLVMRDSSRLVLAGTAIGLLGALPLAPLLRSLLYGIAPVDPVAFAGGSLLLLAVALVASYVPAHRASRVDPTIALRSD
jgi:predicted permease